MITEGRINQWRYYSGTNLKLGHKRNAKFQTSNMERILGNGGEKDRTSRNSQHRTEFLLSSRWARLQQSQAFKFQLYRNAVILNYCWVPGKKEKKKSSPKWRSNGSLDGSKQNMWTVPQTLSLSFVWVLFFKTGSPCVTQTDLELVL